MKKNNLDKDIVNENIKIIEPNILKEKVGIGSLLNLLIVII